MDESGTYGHFGQAIYDHDEKAWHFQRSVESNPTFQLLTEPNIAFEPTVGESSGGFGDDGKEGPSRRRENQAKHLINLHPELQPAGSLLKDLVRTSEAVEESSARFDPIKGNLLAFGVVQDKLTKGRTEVIAFPTGPNGSDLHLVQAQNQRRGWNDVRNTYLRVPTLHGEDTVWKGPGIPIQSIVFANPLEGADNYLAIRLITQILIFRPMLREALVPGGSRLDMNLFVTVDMNQTGDQPFADLAFNPWFARQVAVLDQSGRCTVLELVGNPQVSTKQVAQSESTKAPATKSSLQDCWGRISWISGPSTMAVCTRRNLMVFSVEKKDLEGFYDLDVDLGDVGWILDMVVPSSHSKHVVVVTSHHVVVYHIDKTLASKVAMVRHFRNADDISLRANWFDDGEDVLLLVRSSLDSTAVMYHLHLTSGSEVKFSDPMELSVPCIDTKPPASVLSLNLTSVKMKGDINNIAGGLERSSNAPNARFAQLTTLQKNFSVTQALYIVSAHAELASKIGAPTSAVKLKRIFDKELNDGFIVDDEDDEDVKEVQSRRAPREPVSNFVNRIRAPFSAKAGDWTVGYELSVRQLNDVNVADVVGTDKAIESIEEVMRTGQDSKMLPFRTLNDVCEGEVTVQDVENASTQLQRLALNYASRPSDNDFEYHGEEEQKERAAFLQPMKSLPFLVLPDADFADRLNTIHESLSQAWTRQKADYDGEAMRHAQDQILQRVAAEVTIASVIIRPQITEVERQPEAEAETQAKDNIWELPVRPGAPLSARSTPSVYLDTQSQPQSPRSPRLPTPSETGSSASTPAANLALTRLSHYTTFNGTSKPATLSKRLNRVLSHWTVGADPASYDWSTTSRHFSRREEEEAQDEEMTEKERLRQQRRTERYVRRRQREVEETARIQLLSSQAPAILTSSQPPRRGSQQMGFGGDSQSASQSQGRMAASQVLPGRHGGRPAKKKRKQGF